MTDINIKNLMWFNTKTGTFSIHHGNTYVSKTQVWKTAAALKEYKEKQMELIANAEKDLLPILTQLLKEEQQP
jgi:hypothetical protein